MSSYRRTRQRLSDALNGSEADVDPATKRGLVAIADEVDGLHDEIRDIKASIDALRKTMIATGGSVVLTIVASAVGVFFTRYPIRGTP